MRNTQVIANEPFEATFHFEAPNEPIIAIPFQERMNNQLDELMIPFQPEMNNRSDEPIFRFQRRINNASDESLIPIPFQPRINNRLDESIIQFQPGMNSISDESFFPFQPRMNNLSEESLIPIHEEKLYFIDNQNENNQNPLKLGDNHHTDNSNKIIIPSEDLLYNFQDNPNGFLKITLEEEINNFIDNPIEKINSLTTENNIPENKINLQQLKLDNNEEISNNSLKKVVLISKNKHRKVSKLKKIVNNYENETTKEKTVGKKRGRRKKGSKLEGGHTKTFPGNILRKDGTAFMDSIHTDLNKMCEFQGVDPLKKINFSEQFGYNEDNNRFIKQEIYKILRYRNKHNQRIIKEMTLEKKDIIFTFMINCTFEYLYDKYIKGKNTLYYGKKFIKSNCFKTLTEMANKKESDEEFDKDWTKEKFISSSKKFLDEVKGNGNLKKRKRRKENKVPCEYEEVKEIEDALKTNIFI